MPYISTEVLVGAGLLVVLAFGYQYIQPPSPNPSVNSKNKKKNKKKTKGSETTRDEEARSAPKYETQPVPKPQKVESDHSKPVNNPSKPHAELSSNDTLAKAETAKKRKTLAEKIAPQPRKTKVDDMLAPEDLPGKHARVMRIVDPSPQPKPTTQSAPPNNVDKVEKVEKFAEDYASSEEEASAPKVEDDGWNVVAAKPKKPVSLTLSQSIASAPSSTPLPVSTKIQRKNAKKAEAKKAAKAEEEADRQRRLAMHRRDLERERINDIYASNKKKSSTKGFAGATVDTNGKLIWD